MSPSMSAGSGETTTFSDRSASGLGQRLVAMSQIRPPQSALLVQPQRPCPAMHIAPPSRGLQAVALPAVHSTHFCEVRSQTSLPPAAPLQSASFWQKLPQRCGVADRSQIGASGRSLRWCCTEAQR